MVDEEFVTIEGHSVAEIVEKKSRFIANAYNIESKEEAEEKIKLLKKKYYDAKHNCFAFSVLEEGREFQKCSDDGEPSGTAGAPILNVIKKQNLNNILIVVTRYFGGILLGAGGLTRAYSTAAINAIEKGNLIKKEKGLEVIVELPYTENSKFQYYCEKNNIKVIKTEYNENII
ncbi:MAG: IMPACT family protein, partial [Clostridia bacterium]